jgi:predicted amidohydrolase
MKYLIFFIGCIFCTACTKTTDKSSDTGTVEPGEFIVRTADNMDWLKVEKVKIAAGQVTQDESAYPVMLEYIDRAGAEGCDMIVLPEYIAGTFSSPVRETDPVYQIMEAAARNHIYVIVGGWEEFEPGAMEAKKKGAFSNTALLIDREGRIVGKYSKMHAAVGRAPHWWPPLPGQSEWLMKAGEDFPVFELDFGRVGIMICYDGYFPEPAEILSLHGAELVAWINARHGSVEKHLVQSDIQRDYIAMVCTNQGQGAGTCIATSSSDIPVYVDSTGNHYISGEIDLKGLRTRRASSRVHHQRRPDLYGSITKSHETWKVYEDFIDEKPEK